MRAAGRGGLPMVVGVVVAMMMTFTGAKASGLPATPETATCDVAPRDAAEYAQLVGTVDAGEAIPERRGGQFHAGVPAGVPVDIPTAEAIGSVLDQVIACVNAGDEMRLFALYTDHAIYALGPLSGDTVAASMTATPSPTSPEDRVWIDQIHSIEVLPDARIVAVVTVGGINELDPYPGKTFVFIFAMTRDGWRIDDQFDQVLNDDGTALFSIDEWLHGQSPD